MSWILQSIFRLPENKNELEYHRLMIGYAHPESTETLLSLLREGDHSARERLVSRYLPMLRLGGPLCDSGGARFSGEQNAVIYDNLFALHSGDDLRLESPDVAAALYYNNIEELAGTPTIQIGTLSVANPEFVDALAYDFHLQRTSPMRNMGDATFPLPTIDLDGNRRIVESAPDLGAYEIQDFLFADGFDESP